MEQGWYPTQDGQHVRWFDGTAWTDHVQPMPASVQPAAQPTAQTVTQPAAQPAVQPVAQPAVQPVAQPAVQPAGWYVDPSDTEGRRLRHWDGTGWGSETRDPAAAPGPEVSPAAPAEAPTSAGEQLPEEGWYADPDDPTMVRSRWWDGRDWTDHVLDPADEDKGRRRKGRRGRKAVEAS